MQTNSASATDQNSVTTARKAPRIYYIHPLLLRGAEGWKEAFRHAKSLGFDTVLTAPLTRRGSGTSVFVAEDADRTDTVLELPENHVEAARLLAGMARAEKLNLMLDLAIDRRAAASETQTVLADPRISPIKARSQHVGELSEPEQQTCYESWVSRIGRLAEAGISGFRCLGLDGVPRNIWSRLRQAGGDGRFLAWTPGTDFALRRELAGEFEGCFSSFAWWDLEERWLLEEYNLQRAYGFQIAFPEAPFGKRIAHGIDSVEIRVRRARQRLWLAARLGQGLLVPMGFEFGVATPLDPIHGNGSGIRGLKADGCYDLCADIRALNEKPVQQDEHQQPHLQRLSTGQGSVLALMQSAQDDLRSSSAVHILLLNKDMRKSVAAPMQPVREAASAFLPLREADNQNQQEAGTSLRLPPGEVRILQGTPSQPVLGAMTVPDAETAAESPRLAIEDIMPTVDQGRFPAKRIVGDTITVEADVFGDGHDPISAALFWRAVDEAEWVEVPMRKGENDRWQAEFTPRRVGRHEFAVETWRNPFQIFRYEFGKKHEARLDLHLETQEGTQLIAKAVEANEGPIRDELNVLLSKLKTGSENDRITLLLASSTGQLMAKADKRPHRTRSAAMPLDVERKEAGFASWYQIFPRSQSGDPNRHGTFDDVIKRLPAIRGMGFDVLYFPPIHPIGKTNRKGRNNTLNAGPNDPGSPYGIGSADGGHDAIHPELGTFEDFRRLVQEAQKHGLEIALDLAIQASPDHPWLKEHPGWFDWRPDGTVRYAENPPKKYEDIVNVDFYAPDAIPGLWQELRDVVQVWVDQGVKLFRVDNPHTKPFPFWEWLIADIRNRHPDVVFLSEAFTRPKVMYRLAKVGFSQSYTYFTWRNTKWELETYMHELTQEEPREFFRPHFFVNTHDIHPDYLQNAPRSAYLVRAALAATLSGLWGVYNGFELCEGRPDAKRKEYADSEKYEIRAWDYDRPGNIKGEIALLNRIRRENPALHSHLGLRQLIAWNDNIIFFEKASPARDSVLLVGVNLDPHNAQEADIEIPLWAWNLPDDGTLNLEDLVGGAKFSLTGKWQRLRLEPQMPFSIWRVR